MRQINTKRVLWASAALAGLITLELLAGPFYIPGMPEDASNTEDVKIIPAAPPADRQDISAYSEITARPLFMPSRRPYVPNDEPQVEEVADTTYELIGVTISSDERTALLRPTISNEILRVVEGQDLGPWKVRAIRPTQVTLGRGDGSQNDTVIKINEKRKKFTGAYQPRQEIKPTNAAAEKPTEAEEQPATEGEQATDGEQPTE